MATKESDLNPNQLIHKNIMSSIAKGLIETPLVLKGGTALLLAYGLDRFSEDLDFDSTTRLNLQRKIINLFPQKNPVISINLSKDTEFLTRYKIKYNSEHGQRSLKIEVSYRTPAPADEVKIVEGIRVASIQRIISQKLYAAHDGDRTRSKIRDLYDLNFLARNYPHEFTADLASRLFDFAEDPSGLTARYTPDYREEEFVREKVDIDELVIDINDAAIDIRNAFRLPGPK